MKIVFYAGPAFERWTPETAENGTAAPHGAELFLARAAKDLARRGHDVTVYADTAREIAATSGLSWWKYQNFAADGSERSESGDILIVWRRPEALDWDLSRFGRVYFMAQDNHYGDAITPARAAKVHRFMAISPWHRDFFRSRYPFLAENQIMLTRNGIDLQYAKAVEGAPKFAGSVLWSSSPDRGLEGLLDAWPEVRRRRLDATLCVAYGFENLRHRARGDTHLRGLIERCGKKLDQPGVIYVGRVGQQRMAALYATSHVWVGPHAWDESYCQAAAEAQIGGCLIVSPKRAALATTIEGPTIWTGDLAADIVTAISEPPNPGRQTFDHGTAEACFGLGPVIDRWEAEFRARTAADLSGAVARSDQARLRRTSRSFEAPIVASMLGRAEIDRASVSVNVKLDRPTIGLCMIVKNETARIRRCLESIKPFVDHWTIVDTGSADGTPEVVREIMAGSPGDVFERPWTNWAVTMGEAYALARAHTDYVWIIDADEEVRHDDPGVESGIMDQSDSYAISHHYRGGSVFERTRILSTKLNWVQKGIGPMQIHEYPTVPGMLVSKQTLAGFTIINHNDGNQGSLTPEARRARYAREAENCEIALEADPTDYRAAFYRGQSWRDAGELDRAINAYEWRAQMAGGWNEETFVAALEAAKLRAQRGDEVEIVRSAFLRAWGLRPWRAEPLCHLAGFMRQHRRYEEGLRFAQAAMALGGGPASVKNETLFVDADVYAWRTADELCVASYWCGDYAGSLALAEELIKHGPADQRARFEANRDHAKARLGPDFEPGPALG